MSTNEVAWTSSAYPQNESYEQRLTLFYLGVGKFGPSRPLFALFLRAVGGRARTAGRAETPVTANRPLLAETIAKHGAQLDAARQGSKNCRRSGCSHQGRPTRRRREAVASLLPRRIQRAARDSFDRGTVRRAAVGRGSGVPR